MVLAVMEGVLGLINNHASNLDVILKYQSMLASKQRTLVGRDEYGGPDHSRWVEFSSRFSIDKLKGYHPLKLYMEFFASDFNRKKLVAQGLADMYGAYLRMMLEILKKFEPASVEIEIETGQDYERLLQCSIEKQFQDAYVELTPASGDHGGDLVVDIRGVRLVIQAKYYEANVGNSAVQEAHSGKGFYDADYALVVCDSGYTKHAIELAEKLEVSLCTTDSFLGVIDSIVGKS